MSRYAEAATIGILLLIAVCVVGSPAHAFVIVTMGDSYSSGEGNPDVPQGIDHTILEVPHVVDSARWQDGVCDRSEKSGFKRAYDELVQVLIKRGEITNYNPTENSTFISTACTGAGIKHLVEWYYHPAERDFSSTGWNFTFTDVIFDLRTRVKDLEPKCPNSVQGTLDPLGCGMLPTMKRIVSEAKEPQIDEVSRRLREMGNPPVDALFISIGGNDVGFGDLLVRCAIADTDLRNRLVSTISCEQRDSIGKEVEIGLNGVQGWYDALADAIKKKLPTVKHIYITEYPDFFRGSNGEFCGLGGNPKIFGELLGSPVAGINGETMRWVANVHARLTTKMREAADRHRTDGWVYVGNIADPFKGHGYCATDHWVNQVLEAAGIEGPLNVVLDKQHVSRGSVHPNASGQAVYTRALVDAVMKNNPRFFDPLIVKTVPAKLELCKPQTFHVEAYDPKTNQRLQAGTVTVNGKQYPLNQEIREVLHFVSRPDMQPRPGEVLPLLEPSITVNVPGYHPGGASGYTVMPPPPFVAYYSETPIETLAPGVRRKVQLVLFTAKDPLFTDLVEAEVHKGTPAVATGVVTVAPRLGPVLGETNKPLEVDTQDIFERWVNKVSGDSGFSLLTHWNVVPKPGQECFPGVSLSRLFDPNTKTYQAAVQRIRPDQFANATKSPALKALNAGTAPWQMLPGTATDIASGGGETWIIGTNRLGNGFGIYKWNGTNWDGVDGSAVRIAVASNGLPVVVSADHAISGRGTDGKWRPYPGTATDVAVGPKGSMYIVGTVPAPGGFVIYGWKPETFGGPAGWFPVGNMGGVRIAVDASDLPWIVTADHKIYRWIATSKTWQQVTGEANDIGTGADGSVWIIGTNTSPGGYGIYHWDQAKNNWSPVDGGAVAITVDATGKPWVVNSSGGIGRRTISEGSATAVAQPTAPPLKVPTPPISGGSAVNPADRMKK